MIGVYEKADASNRGSLWHFETALLAAPTINDSNGESKATVTETNGLASGYNIRYTIGDGSQADPTATSSILPSDGLLIESTQILKVVIERYGILLTAVASKEVRPTIIWPSFTLNANGSLDLSAEAGNTIYYTLDGTDPTSSGTRITYSTAITAAAIEGATANVLKAVAVKPNNESSEVHTLQLATYTYKILNIAGAVAVEKAVKQVVGKPLRNGSTDSDSNRITDGYDDIPEGIRSNYIQDETINFYSSSTPSVGRRLIPPLRRPISL